MKIKCPACNAVLEVDSSMSGQVVDCGCGKKLRVPIVDRGTKSTTPSMDADSESNLDSRPGGLGTLGPAGDPSSSSPQSFSVNPDLAAGQAAPQQNPFTTGASDVNPYSASNSPYDGSGQPMPMQGGGDQGLAIASLVLGICSLTLICCGGFFIGIPAVICGVIAIKKANRGEATGKGMAIAGVTTGGISIALFVGYIILAIVSELM